MSSYLTRSMLKRHERSRPNLLRSIGEKQEIVLFIIVDYSTPWEVALLGVSS